MTTKDEEEKDKEEEDPNNLFKHLMDAAYQKKQIRNQINMSTVPQSQPTSQPVFPSWKGQRGNMTDAHWMSLFPEEIEDKDIRGILELLPNDYRSIVQQAITEDYSMYGEPGLMVSGPSAYEIAMIIRRAVERYFEEAYPPFEPEIVSTWDKDYFLPALKVLYRMPIDPQYHSPFSTGAEVFVSPQHRTLWYGNFLRAECHGANQPIIYDPVEDRVKQLPYKFPHENCECGIYGSVNLEEIKLWMQRTQMIGNCVLCIIEPMDGEEVVMCRKGWRAGGAFISEIVGETITVPNATALLSQAWKRRIDLWSLQ